MDEESVFQLLEKLRTKKALSFFIDSMSISDEDLGIDSRAAQQNLGSRIEKVLHKRNGILSDQETNLATEYFRDEYNSAITKASEALKEAQRMPQRTEYLQEALQQTNLAHKQIHRTIRLFPQNDRFNKSPYTHSQLHADLENFRDQIKITWEFPQTYKHIIPLYQKLKEAERSENFNQAAQLRDQISKLTQ